MVIIPQDLKPNEVCIMHSTQVVFFSQFCDLVPLAIITRGVNQIWLHLTEKSRKFKESCNIFATCWNILCQNGDIGKKIPQNLATLAHSFLTKLLYMSHAGFFLSVTAW